MTKIKNEPVLVKSGNKVEAVKLKFRPLHKFNNKAHKGTCNSCLEPTIFRVFAANGTDRLACVRCLNSVRYYKNWPWKKHQIVRTEPLDLRLKIIRFIARTKRWLFGDSVYAPFGRKRKK